MIYEHKVRYYETDKMGITHHSNYIRLMEEARIEFLASLGWDYVKFENEGIISPVVSVTCHYKKPTTFSDIVKIDVSVEFCSAVKLQLKYVIKKEDTIVCEAESVHCFIDQKGRPVRVKKEFPEFYKALMKQAEFVEF